MREWAAKADAAVARVEAMIAFALLGALVLLPVVTGVLRNLGVRFGSVWAQEMLLHFEFSGEFLKKATLAVAFLGASFAARKGKHISVDIAPLLLRGKSKRVLHVVVQIVAALICLALCYSSMRSIAITNDALAIPEGYFFMDDYGATTHVCEASKEVFSANDLSKPTLFCAFRSGVGLLGVKLLAWSYVAELIVPFVFVLMAIRFIGRIFWSKEEEEVIVGVDDVPSKPESEPAS